jgi:N-methylhydantoinase B
MLNAIVSRTKHESDGLAGAGAGAAGKFLINGKQVFEPRKLIMKPTDQVIFETPGGGGFGAPTSGKSKTKATRSVRRKRNQAKR